MILTRSLLCIVALFAPLHAEWETVRHEGHDYVTVRSMKDFYRFTKMEAVGKTLIVENDAVKCRFPLEGTEATLNGVKFHLEFPIIKHEDRYLLSRITLSKTLDPVLRPHYLRGAALDSFSTIVIDPEPMPDADADDLTLQLARKLQAELKTRKFESVLTRTDAQALDLDQRLKVINELDHGIVVSLRITKAAANQEGLRTWVLAPEGVAGFDHVRAPEHFKPVRGNDNDSMNIAIATALHSTTLLATGRPDRGIARSRDPLLTASRHPTVILEVGNLAHEFEAKLLTADPFHKALAKSLSGAMAKAKLATNRRKKAKGTPAPDKAKAPPAADDKE